MPFWAFSFLLLEIHAPNHDPAASHLLSSISGAGHPSTATWCSLIGRAATQRRPWPVASRHVASPCPPPHRGPPGPAAARRPEVARRQIPLAPSPSNLPRLDRTAPDLHRRRLALAGHRSLVADEHLRPRPLPRAPSPFFSLRFSLCSSPVSPPCRNRRRHGSSLEPELPRRRPRLPSLDSPKN